MGHYGIHIHALRHTWATRMARAGVPIQKTKYLGGWKTLAMLSRIYTHLEAEDAMEAMASVQLPEPSFVPESGNKPETLVVAPSEAELEAARKFLEDNGFEVAPRAGLEPATQRLTAACSTN